MSTPEEKLNSPTHSGPARCTLEQLRARWGTVTRHSPFRGEPVDVAPLHLRDVLAHDGMGGRVLWRVEKIEGKRVDLVQEVETR